MRCLWIAISLFLNIWSSLPAAAAEVTCGNVQPVPGPTGYKRRNADRCEGFYQQQVAGAFEFLSLVNGAINYDLETDRTLVVSVPGASRLNASQIFLTARALRPGIYYRMDAVVGPAESFKWPLTVIAPARLPADAIGMVGWINRDLGKYYVPVSVVPESVVASAPRPPTMIFRSSLDVELLRWRSWSEGRESGGATADWVAIGGPTPARIRAGQAIRLELGAKTGGPIVVEVAPKYVNVERVQTLQTRVIMP